LHPGCPSLDVDRVQRHLLGVVDQHRCEGTAGWLRALRVAERAVPTTKPTDPLSGSTVVPQSRNDGGAGNGTTVTGTDVVIEVRGGSGVDGSTTQVAFAASPPPSRD